MEQQPNQPSPENIMKIGTGFWASKILLTAVSFQLFTRLAEMKTMSAKDIKHLLGLNCTDRNVHDFLDALTAFGFLTRSGILDTATYSNTVDTDTFLDKNKPSYIGGLLEMLNNRLYGFWGNLGEGLLTGLPQNETKNSEDFFGLIYQDPEKLKEFTGAMSGIQMGNFMAFAQKFDFTKYKTLIDVGGSAGLLSVMVATYNPAMRCTTFDLPPVEPIASATIQKFGLTDRVNAASGNFFSVPIPHADVVVMGNILHDWDEQNKIVLMQKAYDALPADGAFIAIENIIDDERKQNVFGMMMSLNMLIETGTGFDYTFADFNRWAKIVGFKSTSLLQLTGPSSAAIAYK
ncbi:acetylserotonin O-methyltransferase [Mucilaginibacter sp. SMC90]|uniref:acetylserotonin O-methyltransferase n=1 Tax=Mucilaginibacter sp. SMC90 TaxID=2929803 RepID=UPI001FB1F751|nr:acetylserotonin O-methyltransferase [Mucilaginibacter sp. SMC90]UOE50000.1 acetylserotonin O-methyltransferase [Mucilaginibacter sp. SMC90]